MIRNKSFSVFVMFITVVSIAAVIVTAFFDWRAGIAALLFLAVIDSVFIVFTKQRHKEIRKLSSYFYKVYSGSDVMDISDNIEGELSILKGDICKMTRALQEKNELLKKDKNYLADTLSNISHQLKTPLTSMFMMADLIADPELPQEKREEFLSSLISQLKRIEWLVSSLLKLSKIDADAVDFKNEKITLGELVEKALAPMRIPVEVKEIDLSVIGDKSIEMTLDINWTTEAIINIIKNCIEHTPEGGSIQIECSDSVIYTRLIIKDSGEGISQEDLPHIFERFYKGKNASADSVGIGLAMAKTILNNQNATIETVSSENAGTEFKIKFYKMTV